MNNQKPFKEKVKDEYKNINSGSNKSFNLAIIFITIILFLYCYFGTFSFFKKTFPNVENLNYWKIIYHNCMSFLLFFVCGTIYTKFVMKESLKDYGMNFKEKKLGLILILIAIPITAICGLLATLDGGMTQTYPLVDLHTYGSFFYVFIYFLSYLLYYIGWEYLFRGLMQNSCKNATSPLTAILLATLLSSLIHTCIADFGKPLVETLSAIPAGLIFGYIAYKTKSIIPSICIHFFVGFFTDLFIFLII